MKEGPMSPRLRRGRGFLLSEKSLGRLGFKAKALTLAVTLANRYVRPLVWLGKQRYEKRQLCASSAVSNIRRWTVKLSRRGIAKVCLLAAPVSTLGASPQGSP